MNPKKASDRMVCFVIMLSLGQSERIAMERAVERYADGPDADIRDEQREKRRKREWLQRFL